MANVDWQGFLRGIRESIETIRTPIDPIAIQGTAHCAVKTVKVAADSTGMAEVFPPSDGYNRVNVLTKHPRTADLLLNHQPSQGSQFIGYALHNPLTGVHLNVSSQVWYTIEIPDRDSFLTLRYDNSDSYDETEIQLTCVFWRQY